jgi:hypothetical protein
MVRGFSATKAGYGGTLGDALSGILHGTLDAVRLHLDDQDGFAILDFLRIDFESHYFLSRQL